MIFVDSGLWIAYFTGVDNAPTQLLDATFCRSPNTSCNPDPRVHWFSSKHNATGVWTLPI